MKFPLTTLLSTLFVKACLLTACTFTLPACLYDRHGRVNMDYLDYLGPTYQERRKAGLEDNARYRPYRPANAPPNTYRQLQQSHAGGTRTSHLRPPSVKEPANAYWHYRKTGTTLKRPPAKAVAPTPKKTTARIADPAR